MMLAEGHRIRIRGSLSNMVSRFCRRKGQSSFELAVLGKSFDSRPVQITAIPIELIGSLIRLPQCSHHIMSIRH